MKMDPKTKAARSPARLKTHNSNNRGNDTEEKPNRSVPRAKRAKGQLPGIEQGESIGSPQRLLATFEHAPIGIIEGSLEGQHINVNEEFCRITGYGKDELLARGIKDLTYEEDYIFDIKLHQRLVAGDIPFYKLEKRYVRKDGKIIWTEVTRSLVRNDAGKPLYTIGAVLDVSERRQAEQALRESEALLAVELADTKKLQNISSQLIQEDNIKDLYEQILDAAIALMRSDMGSIQVFHPEKNELQLLAWKGFDPASAAFWEWVLPDSNSTCGVALNTRERVIVQDVETCDFMAGTDDLDFHRLSGIRAVQATPLFSRSGLIVGMISTHWRQPHQPSERDLSLFDVLMRQAADLIERSQAGQALAESARQQQALFQLADQLHRTNSLEAVFSSAMDAILRALPCDRASILLFDHMGVMRFVAWRGLSDGYRQATEGHSPWKPDERNAEPISINNIRTAELSDSLRAVIEEEGIGSLAFVPLVSNGKLIGKFMIYFNVPHVFDEAELDLSLTIAHQLAFGVDRKRAENVLRIRARQQQAVARLGELALRERDLQQVFDRATATVAETLEIEYCKVLELLGDRKDLLLRAGVGWKKGLVGNATVSASFDSQAGYTLVSDTPVVVIDLREEQRFSGPALLIEHGIISGMSCIVRRTDGIPWGVLGVHTSRRMEFTEDDVNFLLGVANILGDAIHREQAEQALRESEARYRAIARSIPGGGIYVVDKDFRYLVAEGPVTEAFGLSREMLEGHTVSEIFPNETGELMKERLQQNFAGETTSYETEHDGHVYWTQQAPLLDPIGQAIVVTIDITNQKQAEEALRESKERYRDLFDLVPVAVYTCDADGLIQEYNQRAVELWGREPQKHDPDEKYCGSFKIFYPDGRFMPHGECPMARILGGEMLQPHELEILVERPDGARRNVIAHPLPLKNERGEIMGAINCLYDITERKQAEEKLRESENFVRSTLDSLISSVAIIDRSGVILDVNDAWIQFAKANGYNSPHFGIGENYLDVVRQAVASGEQSAQLIVDGIEAVLNDTKPKYEFEYPCHSPDEQRWFILNVSPLAIAQGGAVVTHTNITERKEADEKILFQANLLGAVGSAVIATDLNGIVLYWNPAAEKLYGWSSSEALGKNIVEVAHAPQSQEQAREIMKQLASGKSWSGDFLVQRRDGSTFPAFVSDSPFLDSNGKLVGVIGISSDITKLKQAEEALQQLNLQLESRVQKRTATIQAINQSLREEIAERKRAEGQLLYQARLIANVNDAIVATDENLAIGYWNQAAEQIYGWKAEEVMGRRVSDVLQSEFVDGNTRAGALQKVNDAGELRTAVTQSRKDGTRIFVEARTSTLRNEEGKIVGYISINRDVTERTQMDEALRKSRERLQVLSQRLVEVQEEERRAIARELHDRVGQTLAALNINLIIMNDQLLEDSKQRIGSRLDDSMQLVAEAIALVRDVMTDLRPAVLDDYGLEAALESYVEQYKSRYEIDVVLEPPDQPIPRLGLSLEMTLLRIAQEALFNVARHAQADLVNVSLQLQDGAVHLMVQDNGVGFESSQGTNHAGSHGLKIMRERAEAFGGRVDVRSVPGEGTKVEARIPIGNGGQNQVQGETG